MHAALSPKAKESLGSVTLRLNRQVEKQLALSTRAQEETRRRTDRAIAHEEQQREKAAAALEKKLAPRRVVAAVGLATLLEFAQSKELIALFEAERRADRSAGYWFDFFAAQRSALAHEAEYPQEGPSLFIRIHADHLYIGIGPSWEQEVDYRIHHLYFAEQEDKDGKFHAWLHDTRDTYGAVIPTFEDYLKRIAEVKSPRPLPLAFAESPAGADWDENELLFQVLIDCANPRTFNRYLAKAMAHHRAEYEKKK